MGKGKNDRARSNVARKRRKVRELKMLKHLMKHPEYYNAKNPIPCCDISLIFIFYILLIACIQDE